VADTPLSAPRSLSEALGSSGFAPEWALIPEPLGYTVILDKIFIPLATLKAACRNQVSNLFLTMEVVVQRSLTVMTLKFTRRQKGFKATPMDFLILVIALVVPSLPERFIDAPHMGFIAVKLIVLYFSFEVLTGELRGELRKIALGMLTALVLLAVRGVVG
jgi:hypothetical protein